jgi:hypothetical protein
MQTLYLTLFISLFQSLNGGMAFLQYDPSQNRSYQTLECEYKKGILD